MVFSGEALGYVLVGGLGRGLTQESRPQEEDLPRVSDQGRPGSGASIILRREKGQPMDF